MHTKIVVWMLLAVVVQWGLDAPAHAQVGRTATTHQGMPLSGRPEARIDQPRTPGGEPQLKPMFLDKKLFLADHWWQYEEADDDRPPAFSVEQTGTASLAGHSLFDHGAQVQYRVREYATPATAHLVLQQMIDASRRPRNVKRTQTHLSQGDEAVEISTVLVDDGGKAVEFGRDTIVRYGKYVAYVSSKSDLRAPGPRPASGQRRWMSEPVHDRVVAAMLARWTRYKALLASR